MNCTLAFLTQEENGNRDLGARTYALIILLLCNLIDLVQQLSDAQLQLSHLLLLCYLSVVDGMLAHLYIHMDA